MLHAAYVLLVRHGGFFVPTIKKYEREEEVFVIPEFMDELEKIQINGKMVWTVPNGAQGNR